MPLISRGRGEGEGDANARNFAAMGTGGRVDEEILKLSTKGID